MFAMREDTRPKHVWLCVTGRWHEAEPGILTAWRSGADGRWEGYVIATRTHSTGSGVGVTVMQDWHRVEHIRDAETVRPREIDG